MKNRKILNKLLVWFLLITLLPATIVTFINYRISSSSQKKEVTNNLISITESKVNQIETFIDERERNVATIARIPQVIEAIETYKSIFKKSGVNSQEYKNFDNKIRPFLTNYLEIFGYSNIFLISQSGDTVFSVKQAKEASTNLYKGIYKNSELAKVFDRSKTLMQVEISNFNYYAATNEPAIFIATPVLKNAFVIGVVILQIDNKELYKVVNDYTGLGKTGETILGSKIHGKIFFTAPTRHDPNAAFKRIVNSNTKEKNLLEQAIKGIKGNNINIDYRNQETIAAWRYLPSLNGGIIVKIDTKEALASLKDQKNIVIILATVTLFLVFIAAILVAQSISKPIVELTTVVKEISQGDLSKKAPITTLDEIGQLAQSFNTMAEKLQESFANLEDKVKERTAELATANEAIITLNEKLKEENLRMGAELSIVRQMQQMILPRPEELEIEGLDIAGYMEPAEEVGGDYYDVLYTDGVVTIGIGDVTGHGLESGILMLMTQTSVRTLKEIREADPVRFLDVLNRTIYKNVQRMNSDKSLTLGILNYVQGKLSISGQHEEAIVVRNSGHIEMIDTMDLGFPIGLDGNIADFIDQKLIELEPGDGVVLYTDGITEAEDINQKQYGIERLCDVVSQNWQSSAQEIKQAVIRDLRRFIGEQKVFDDITLLVLKQ
ncbi:MAG: SpoIIE family protein phosphatase [Scytonematopsis contorta HA4267-MV1]|jgi:serine phosphatase RsbU (regulator of sigma subunit)|nr:SpoIIE family protein phosphatase [Scytonematopsis contorta HA4267-MV1]